MKPIKGLLASLLLMGTIANPADAQNLTINQTSLHLPTGVKNVEIPFSSPVSCTITSNQSWVTQDTKRSTINNLGLQLSNNPTNEPRTATLRVSQIGGSDSKEIHITQYGAPDLSIGRNPNLNEQSFPGAEGGGAVATGGRGGQVLYVTTLEDRATNPPTGSLRWAINQSGARTILFKVAGVIELKATLVIRNGNLTIAGQSAPGEGITIKDYTTRLNDNVENVVIRFIRFRMGDEAKTEDDPIWGRYAKKVMIDHCTMSWSTDECGSFYDNRDFTLQWSILSESLRYSVHGKGTHGYGGIWGGENASFHHNILAHHDSRTPRMNGTRYVFPDPDELVDFRNNVIHNWGQNNAHAGEGGNYNIVNNYYQPSSITSSRRRPQIFAPAKGTHGTGDIWGAFHIEGNQMMNVNGSVNTKVTSNNWDGGVIANSTSESKPMEELRILTPFSVSSVTTHTAAVAFQKAAQTAGASFARDTVDRRVAREVATNSITYTSGGNGSTGGLIDTQEAVEGWELYKALFQTGEAPTDSDGDGIPDQWEVAYGLNPNSASDGNAKTMDPSGRYTNLEVYLHNLVQHIVQSEMADGIPSIPQSNRPTRLTTLRTVNPIQNNLLQMKCDEPLSRIRLYSLTGMLIIDTAVEGTTPEVELPNLPKGSYLLSVETESGAVQNTKVVK